MEKSLKEIKELYLKRWNIEKAFKDIFYVSELYNFGLLTGKTLFPIWEYAS